MYENVQQIHCLSYFILLFQGRDKILLYFRTMPHLPLQMSGKHFDNQDYLTS